MIGFCIFKNIYYNVDIAYQNKILGNIFNLNNVSVSGVIVDNKKIVFKIFCCGIFYQYIFVIGRGIHNIKYMDRPYLISVSSYNKLLELQGKEPISLNDNEVALYNDPEYCVGKTVELALKERPRLYIAGQEYKILDKYYSDSIVTDRLITINYGLIVPDQFLNNHTNYVDSYFNITLDKDFVKENGLMQAIDELNKKINIGEISYESYLQNIGRELFYIVAASYTTIYLAVIFLVIANTVMGVQFLMHQQKTKKRYTSLTYIGATYEMLCKSARKQINWYFSLPLVVASISSIFAVRALFTGAITTNMKEEIRNMMIVSTGIIMLICIIELLYMSIVKKSSDKNILRLMDVKREDN